MKFREKEGCRKCKIAFPNTDGSDFETPEKLEGLAELSYTYTYAEGSGYGDNELKIYKKKPTGVDITLTFLDIPTKLLARILGKKYSKGGMVTGTKDNPIPVAIMFEETYSDDSFIDTVFYNVKLSKDENTAKTTADGIEFTPITLTGKALPYTNSKVEGGIDFRMDSADPEVDKTKLNSFFDKVQFFEEDSAEKNAGKVNLNK